jgi:peptidoglycan/xylan/chitin deacetylase (PgdA/CDA1 family)
MRVAFKNILGVAGGWIPLKLIRGITGMRDIFPFYHAVSDEDLPHLKHLYTVKTQKRFIMDLDYFLSRYEPVSMSDWYEFSLGRKKLNKPAMVLSFDDGLRQVNDVIVPILTSKGVPATFFINPSFVDNKKLFYKYKASLIIDRLEKHGYPVSLLEVISSRLDVSFKNKDSLKRALLNVNHQDKDFLKTMAELVEVDFKTFLRIRKPYLSTKQILKIKKQGFGIGSHSMNHPLFSLLSHEEQLQELKESLKWLNKKLKPEYKYFAFPFTDEGVDSIFFDRIFSWKKPLVDMSFGTAGLKRDPYPFHFQRIPMDVTKSGARIFLKGEYIYYLLKSILGKNIIRRKS